MTDAQLIITDNTLTITDGESSTEITLPKLPYESVVHVWSVPSDYRAIGYYVSAQQAGKPREIPACDIRQTLYLGKITYPADDIAEALDRLPSIRWQRVAAGTTWNEWPVKTGPEDIPLIHAVYTSASIGSRQDGARFKFADGICRQLTNAEAVDFGDAVFSWVQAHFDHEADLADQIQEGLQPDINEGWPA